MLTTSFTEHLYDRKHPEDIEEFTEADKDASARSAFISKEWVKGAFSFISSHPERD